MANGNKCPNEICSCLVAVDKKYCSDHCKDAVEQDIIEIKCDCGHRDCEGEV